MKTLTYQKNQQDALRTAKAIQKPQQTKEQTKIITQGIEKGIAEYKKQQKIKARERDKLRKQTLKNQPCYADKQQPLEIHNDTLHSWQFNRTSYLLLGLLIASWAGFIGFNLI